GLPPGPDGAPVQIIEDPGPGEKRKIYRGMTSPQAVFRALYDDEEPDAVETALEVPAEGQEMQVPYRGSVVDILRRIRGHLRSAVSYGGAGALAQPPPQGLPDAPALRRQLRRGGVTGPAARQGAPGPAALPRPALLGLPRRILRTLKIGVRP